MVDKQTRKWVATWLSRHGLEYIPEDWGEHGEYPFSGNAMPTAGLKPGKHNIPIPYVLDHRTPPWKQRATPEEREKIEALEDFFTPYISQLPQAKGQVLYEYMFLRRTFDEVTGYRSRQASSQALKRALQDLARLVAEDYPGYVRPADGRVRDKVAELTGMKDSLNRFWSERFGVPYVIGDELPFIAAPRPPMRHADPNGRTRNVKEKEGGARNYFQTYVRAEHDRKFGGQPMPKCPTCGRWAWAGHSRIHVYDSGEVRTRT